MDVAVGKYIYFCDGDDYIEKELLNDAVQAMDGYDVVVFNREDVDVNGCPVRRATDYHGESDKWTIEYRSGFIAFDYFYWKISDIRSYLLDDIKDTGYFLEQARAFVNSGRLFIRNWSRGPINARMILSEWSYYLNGNRLQLIIMKIMFWLDRAVKKLKRLFSRPVRHVRSHGKS